LIIPLLSPLYQREVACLPVGREGILGKEEVE